MDDKISQQFLEELQRIVQHKPLSEEFHALSTPSDSVLNLKEGFEYLSTSLLEVNHFLTAICQGNLQVPVPERYNFFAGPLKEIHSILNHLTWQTIQVAKGDYTQHIDYLGDFSTHFNSMIEQLQKREALLKEQATILNQTLSLFELITNLEEHWILVLDTQSKEFIYANDSAKAFFFNPDTNQSVCKKTCQLLDKLFSFSDTKESFHFEYYCSLSTTHILIKGFPILWNNKDTIVFYLKDVTLEKEKKELLKDIAYRDSLTRIHNRRYFIEYMDNLSLYKRAYSIISIDVDNLKYVNDTFGHITGDDYLCTVVSTIKNYIRDNDVFCRLGGDEFLILLPSCPEDIAIAKMEQINETLHSLQKEYPLSISYGILYVSENNTMLLNEILSAIDKKMYLYKKTHKKPSPFPPSNIQ